MNPKVLNLQKRTVRLIQHATMRLAELRNILTITNIFIDNPECNGVIKELDRRIRKMERRPGYAGKHERHKIPP